MPNFTKSSFNFNGTTYSRYTGDRKRGGASWVFYDSVPVNTTYSPTWPAYILADVTVGVLTFLSKIQEDLIHVDFLADLTSGQETALESLYTNHIAPVAV